MKRPIKEDYSIGLPPSSYRGWRTYTEDLDKYIDHIEETTNRIEEGVDIYKGITTRDYFAAKAMQAMIIHFGGQCDSDHDWHSLKAYEVADNMMVARKSATK